MHLSYRANAPEKTVNLSLNSDQLRTRKDLWMNLSIVAEAAVAQAFRESLAEHWLKQNVEAIQAYNQHVEAHGVFSDDLRVF